MLITTTTSTLHNLKKQPPQKKLSETKMHEHISYIDFLESSYFVLCSYKVTLLPFLKIGKATMLKYSSNIERPKRWTKSQS